MYLIAKDSEVIKGLYSVPIQIDMSQMLKVVRTAACSAGEYALFRKNDDDKDKFSIFCGYITFDDVCDAFELIKVKKPAKKGKK